MNGLTNTTYPYVPAGQGIGSVDASGQYDPLGHIPKVLPYSSLLGVGVVDPPCEKYPAAIFPVTFV